MTGALNLYFDWWVFKIVDCYCHFSFLLLKFLKRVKWNLMKCYDIFEKNNYPYSPLYVALKRKAYCWSQRASSYYCFFNVTFKKLLTNFVRELHAIFLSSLSDPKYSGFYVFNLSYLFSDRMIKSGLYIRTPAVTSCHHRRKWKT